MCRSHLLTYLSSSHVACTTLAPPLLRSLLLSPVTSPRVDAPTSVHRIGVGGWFPALGSESGRVKAMLVSFWRREAVVDHVNARSSGSVAVD